MQKRKLGRTNLNVTLSGLGAWSIGGKSYGDVSFDQGLEVVKRYIELGGNHIDTAEGYGDSEKIIGEALRQIDSEHVIIASKTINDGKEENIKNVRLALEKTLSDIGRESVDLYYLHFPPSDSNDMDRLLNEYVNLKKEGKINYIGASIKGVDVTDETIELCKKYIEDGRVDVIELVFSVFRQKTREIFDLAEKNNIGLICRTSLESGFLTGKYKLGHNFSENDHRSRWEVDKLNMIFSEVDYLQSYVKETPYDNISELAIKFAMSHQSFVSVIVGAKNVNQLEANMRVESLEDLNEIQLTHLKKRYKDFTPNCNTK